MANPTWFDAAHYKAQKLAQLQATDSNGGWTAAKLDTVLTEAGFGGAEGAFAHFTQYGSLEHCSPNATFNAAEYLAAKLVQLQATDKLWAGKTLTDVQNALKSAGLGEYEHYQLYGSKESLNPSNAFDEVAYLDAKLGQLVTTDPTNWTGKTTLDVRASLQASGLTALEHYLAYGKTEGIVATAVADDAKVTVPADFYIFGGKGGMPSEGYELTRGADNLTGTAGNDSFFAAGANGFETLNASDTLNGGAGDDTLYIGNGAGVQNFGKASIKSIEHVVSVDTGKLDVSANADVKDVVAKGDVTAKLAQGVTLKEIDETNGAVNAVVKFVDAAGADDAATVALDSNDMNSLTVEGIEKLTLNVTGKNSDYDAATDTHSSIVFTDKALKELTVTGEGSVMLSGGGDNGSLSKVDFSANKGGVNLSVAAAALAKEVTVTGGVGDDTFIANTTNTTNKKITLDLGAGNDTLEIVGDVNKGSSFAAGEGTDTLVLNAVGTAITEEKAKLFTGFEEVVLKGVSTFEGSYFKSITEATVKAHAGTSTVKALDTIVVTSDGTTATLDNLTATGITTLDLTFDNMQIDTASGDTITALQTNATTLNIHSLGNVLSNSDNELAGLQDATTLLTINNTVTKINIDGTQAFTFDAGTNATITKINAENLSGDLTLDLGSVTKDVTVIAGSGKNTITLSATKYDDVDLTASAGKQDKIIFGAVTASASGGTIDGFDAGAEGDILQYGSAGTAITDLYAVKAGHTSALHTASSVTAGAFNELVQSLGASATDKTTIASTVIALAGTKTMSTGEKGLLVVYSDSDAYLYYVTSVDASLDDTDLTLIGTLEGVKPGELTADNFMI